MYTAYTDRSEIPFVLNAKAGMGGQLWQTLSTVLCYEFPSPYPIDQQAPSRHRAKQLG